MSTPADALVIDIDSTICEVIGNHKQGAGYGYTRNLGLSPRPGLTPVRCCTARMRKGSANTQRGTRRLFDSGFWANDIILALNRLDV